MISRPTSMLSKKMMIFPDYTKVMWGGTRIVVGAARLVTGAPSHLLSPPRCSQTYLNDSHGFSVPVIIYPSYSQWWPDCPPRVWYSPEINTYKLSLDILSFTPGGFHWQNNILLMDYGAWTTEAIFGSWKFMVHTYFLETIQLSVDIYLPGLCIYSKHVADTFLQKIDRHGAWQLWHECGGLQVPIKSRFRYLLKACGMSRACTSTFSVCKMILSVRWKP